MSGKPTVASAQNAREPGKFSCSIERPSPPNLTGEKDNGFGAAVHIAAGRGDAHFSQQILGRQGEKGLHARVLQSGEAEAALFEGAAEATGKGGADTTVAVEEDPAAEGMPSFRISYF